MSDICKSQEKERTRYLQISQKERTNRLDLKMYEDQFTGQIA